MPDDLRFDSLTQAREALRTLRATATQTSRGMTLHQALLHCAQSVEYPLTGFPALKPAFLRATIGRLVGNRFLARGSMQHDLAALVPGAPPLPPEGDLDAAWDRLLGAIDGFLAHSGPLHPHFVFGTLPKDRFERILAMHIADHASALAPR